MGMIKEFKEFAVKGNMIDMAVGIIIGGAFGKIISSLVKDVIMPPIGKLVGNVDFTMLSLNLGGSDPAVAGSKDVFLNYGLFLQNLFDFLIIAFAVFMIVKIINSAKKKEEEAPKAPPAEEVLLTEIRDLLKK